MPTHYLVEFEEASNIVDTQPDLLQCSRADEIDCKLVDVVFVSRMVELDNGYVFHICIPS